MSSERIPLPLQLIVLSIFATVLIIGGFTFALVRFINSGSRDAEARRRRLGSAAKDPMDPNFTGSKPPPPFDSDASA